MSDQELPIVTPNGAKKPYWEHFGFLTYDDGKKANDKAVRCNLCKRDIGFSGNTSNLRQHLEKWHREVLPGSSDSAASLRQATLEKALREVNSVALTSDFWSSHAVDSYLVVTAHSISPERVLQSHVLQTREVVDSHTSVNRPFHDDVMGALNGESTCHVLTPFSAHIYPPLQPTSTAHRVFALFQLTGNVDPAASTRKPELRRLDDRSELYTIGLVL